MTDDPTFQRSHYGADNITAAEKLLTGLHDEDDPAIQAAAHALLALVPLLAEIADRLDTLVARERRHRWTGKP